MRFGLKKIFMMISLFPLLTVGCSIAADSSGDMQAEVHPLPAEARAPSSIEETVDEILPPSHSPIGVFTRSNEGTSLALFDLQGLQIGEVFTPGAAELGPGNLHVAGGRNERGLLPVMIYRSWDPEQAVLANENGSVSKLRDTASFLAMVGAEGQAVFSFSEILFEEEGPHSFLFAVTLDNAGSTDPFLELSNDATNMALLPVGVEAIDNQPQGVWYTKTAWGMGGVDLVFPITRGLYFYDLTSGENLQVISPARSFQGISPDLNYAASVEFEMKGDKSIRVHNLANDQTVHFALHPDSDRGAGFCVFSPDNRFAAWAEGQGSLASELSNFTTRVRIGEISSAGVVQEVDSKAASSALGWERVAMMKPVGWLDNDNVLVETRSAGWSQVSLLKLNIIAGELSNFCTGSFAAFLYPE